MKNIFDEMPEYSPEVLKAIEERYGNAEYKITQIACKSPYSTLYPIFTTQVKGAEEEMQKVITRLNQLCSKTKTK